MKLQHIIDKFDEYLNPRKNITFLRFKFFSYNQGEGQLTDDYVTELKARSQQCEFGDLRESYQRQNCIRSTGQENSGKVIERNRLITG